MQIASLLYNIVIRLRDMTILSYTADFIHIREAQVAEAASALRLSPLKPFLVSVFHVRDFSLLISPVLRGFFSQLG